ncbi:MAG: tetratricopeptide repeat protein [Legionellales bacterium]|nr:tetratricopeptide repeat protein [Legionellales bacterium]
MNKYLLLIFYIIFSNQAYCFGESLFNENYQGYTDYKQERYAKAYEKFSKPHWKALAALKNNKLEDAIDLLVEVKTITGKYNLGTAYALQGDFDNAINMYNDVLKIDPGHTDSKYNLELVKKLKKQSENSKQDGKNGKSGKDGKNSDKSDGQNNQDSNSKQDETSSKERKDQKSSNKDEQKQGQNDLNKANQNQNGKQQQENKNQQQNNDTANAMENDKKDAKYDEKQQADEQWLRSIPDDPGGLLRNKFLRDHLKRRGELR